MSLMLLDCFATAGQDTLSFDLNISVLSARTKRLIPHAHVKVTDQNQQLIFDGFTDPSGEVFPG